MYHDQCPRNMSTQFSKAVLPATGRADGKDLDKRGDDHLSIGSYIFFTNCKFV